MRRLRSDLESAVDQSQLDLLTGLLNRRGLEPQLASAHPRGLPAGAMLSIEINQFSPYIDKYGNLRVIGCWPRLPEQLLSVAPYEGALPGRDRGSIFLRWLPGATPAVAAGFELRIRRQDVEQNADPVSVTLRTATVAEG